MTFKIKQLISIFVLSTAAGCADLSIEQAMQAGFDISQVLSQNSEQSYGKAIKDTLELSSTRAANVLSVKGGYSDNPLYKIGMPEQLNRVTSTLRTLGLNRQVDEVERLMNQGAEEAASEAKAVFIDTVQQMTITDALSIIQGNETAATDYFKAKTETILRQRYQPIIQNHLNQVGFYNEYKQLLASYNKLPIANKPELDLQQHVLNESLAGLFSQVAKEEALIREDPVGRGSAFLGTVFGK